MHPIPLCQLNNGQVIAENAVHLHLVEDDVIHEVIITSLLSNLIKLHVGLDLNFDINVITTNQNCAYTVATPRVR